MRRPSKLPALGPRGEGWVLAQGILIASVVVAGSRGPAWPDVWNGGRRTLALALGVTGLGLALAGMQGLGRALTPFPKPVAAGALTEHGAYRLVRHPIYGGLLLVSLAWSLWRSPLVLLPTVLLALLFEGKRRREEAWLAERYAGYPAYAERVRRRFVPFIW